MPTSKYFPPRHPEFKRFSELAWQNGSFLSVLVPELGRKQVSARKRAIAGLVWLALRGYNRHRKNPEAVPFSRDFLRDVLGRTDVSGYIDPLFNYTKGHRGYDSKRGVCKGYILKEEVHQAAAALARIASREHLDDFLDSHGPGDQPVSVPIALAQITVETCEQAMDRIDPCDHESRRILRFIREDVMVHGGLPNLYDGTLSNGRPRAIGRSHQLNLPRLVRHALFQNTGFWDNDICSCHASVFVSVASHFQVHLPHWERFIQEREEVMSEWAEATGHRKVEDFKVLVLALLSGGGLTPIMGVQRWSPFSYNAAKAWVALADVKALHAEAKGASDAILQRYGAPSYDHNTGEPTFLTWNAAGCCVETTKPGAAMSQLLHGWEQWAMSYILSSAPEGSVLSTSNDGWISNARLSSKKLRRIEEGLRRASRKQLGVELVLSIKSQRYGEGARAKDALPRKEYLDF